MATAAFASKVMWPNLMEEHDLSDVDEEPIDAHLGGSTQRIEAAHELLVEIPKQELLRLPIDHSPARRAVLDLGRHLAGIEPVLRRVVLKLVRRGERRSLARTAAFVWVGFERSDGRRFVGQRPVNLSAAACLHLDINDDRVALPIDRSYATARLAVDDVDGKARREVFEFAYPGLGAVLRWLDADGARREQVLERDAVVALRPGDARLLEVSSPDPGAILLVGAEVHPQAFANRSRIGIPLATVADACRGGADQLAIRGADGTEITLARFTVPCEVVRWTENFDRLRRERSLLLGFHEPVQQLRVRVRDLWGGTKAELVLEADALRRRVITNGMSLRLEQDVGGPLHGERLVIELDDWPSGLWLMDLDAQLGQGGRWQALVNLRGDVYAWLLSHGLDEILAGDLGQGLGLAGQIQIFARCHKELQRCFAPPCWQGGVNQILRLWRRLGGSLATDPRLEGYWPALLPLAFIEPPLEASESWLPLVSFWDVLPEFMALRGSSYANLRQIGRDDTAVLALLAELAEAGSVARFLQHGDRLDIQFFRCFANLAEVHRSDCLAECRGFSFKVYADLMRRTAEDGGDLGWLTSEPMLSSSHYLTAFERLVRRYRTLTAGQGNAQRLPGAARLVQDALRWLDREGRARAEAAIPDLALDGASLALSVPVDEDEDALLQDAPTALSAIALACRLEPRRPGALDAFIASLAGADRDREKVSADLNFLTAAGADLFAFWLLFWDVLLTTGERCRT